MLSLFLIAWSVLQWSIRLVMTVVILLRRRKPAASLAWLLIIFAVPEVGMIMYLLIGERPLGMLALKQYRQVAGQSKTPERLAAMQAHAEVPEVGPIARNMIVQAEHVSGNPILRGSHVDLLSGGAESLESALEDLAKAEHHIHMLYYIFWPDATGQRIAEALLEARKRGVTCRLIVDAVGSRPLIKHALYRDLMDAGVQVVTALPVKPWRLKLARIDVRNHRKLTIVDGKIAYTGSHNVVAPSYGGKAKDLEWVDLSGRFTGPVVAQMQMMFLDDWGFETGEMLDDDALFPKLEAVGQMPMQFVPTGPTHEIETFRRVLIAALNAAREQIIITTPYLIPDEPTLLALSMAAGRGAKVTVVVPEKIDQPIVAAASNSYHDHLLRAGVKLHLYRGGLLHAKTITVDDSFALLGSANLDNRSFDLNFEAAVLMYGPQVTAQLRFAQQAYLKSAEPLNLNAWRQRPFHRRMLENAANIFSPLL